MFFGRDYLYHRTEGGIAGNHPVAFGSLKSKRRQPITEYGLRLGYAHRIRNDTRNLQYAGMGTDTQANPIHSVLEAEVLPHEVQNLDIPDSP